MIKLIAIFSIFFMVPIQWDPDFEHAKKVAKEKNELILLNFSGSDWCAPCIMLRKDYLESDTFQQMADGNLIMVNADFPRKKKNIGTPETIKRNEALAEIYNKRGVFPITMLLDADGKVLKVWEGKPAISVEDWTAQIKAICDTRK